jgi:polyferredoxin
MEQHEIGTAEALAEVAVAVAPTVVPIPSTAPLARKKLVRRVEPDRSQQIRRSFQWLFLVLNIALGTQFYFWVRAFEAGGAYVPRPAGVEGWLPIAGLMNLKYFVMTGRVPSIHPASMFLLLAFLAMAFLLRKSFCGWLCPVGTLSETLWRAGKRFFGRTFAFPRWLDLPLRGLKYLLLGFFAWAVAGMPATAIDAFMHSPYGVIADVKMLNFFRYIGTTVLAVLALLAIASLFVQNFWCRYLCPYGALLGLAALASPLRIRREAAACIDCAKCARACPSQLPVDKLVTIKPAECTACLECVAVCPAEGALHMTLPGMFSPPGRKPARISPWAMAAALALLFAGVVGFAKSNGVWESRVPDHVYRQLVPHANEASHPMPGDAAPAE